MLTRHLPLMIVLLGFGSAVDYFESARADDLSKYATSREPIGENGSGQRYRTKWALVVGIDYAEGVEDRATLPRLSNARSDAKALSDKLIGKYGYDAKNVVTVLESDATRDRLLRELEKFRSEQVSSDDSVLVFFAGHGARHSDGVVFYPHDIEIRSGKATAGLISIRDHILMELNKSKARHCLLILDSCYSGDVFSQGLELQAVADADDASDESTFLQRGIQVIASCRGWETASDGNGVHSPFATALLRGLEEIPAIDREPPRIWTSRLMKTLEEEFRGMPNGQRPSYRSLAGGVGEFTFFPDFKNATFGDHSHGQLLSVAMLRVTSPGVKGNWWFEEMPWFIPSFRERILMHNHVRSRTSDYAASINPYALNEVALRVEREIRSEFKSNGKASSDATSVNTDHPATSSQRLQELRWNHFNKLLKETDPAARLKILELIEADLLDPENAKILQATDLHLLAVVQHAIGKAEAIESYESALRAYTATSESNVNAGKVSQALTSLCYADYGDCLDALGSESSTVIEQFNRALTSVGLNPPEAFHVYCLCRQASAYLKDNRWEDAKSRLQRAVEVVNKFNSDSHLAAFVHRNDAWSKMIQWNVAEAEESFELSNSILLPLIAKSVSPEKMEADDRHFATATSTAFRSSADFDAKVAYFHNLHGLAMARRYRGYAQDAAAEYRQLIALIEDALVQLNNVQVEATTHRRSEASLLSRFVNSQERLGDCNLLGEESERDLAEAADDYRRAVARVHRLPSGSRNSLRSQLLYKQSLALAIPSAVQDIELALEMCNEADRLLEESKTKSTGMLLALQALTTPLVEMIAERPSGIPIISEVDANTKSAALRTAIHNLRDVVKQSAHRDQLELMLFATKGLIQYGTEPSRLRRSEDVELLLGFNRMALNRIDEDAADGMRVSSQAFLRQYYDVAFSSSLETTPNNTKRLLQIQHEATMGGRHEKAGLSVSADTKQAALSPTIAVYGVDDKPYLILDTPNGLGVCIGLSDVCTMRELIDTSRDHTRPCLRLPSRVVHTLDLHYRKPGHEGHTCTLCFDDPLWNVKFPPPHVVKWAGYPIDGEVSEVQSDPANPVDKNRFPFELPDTVASRLTVK